MPKCIVTNGIKNKEDADRFLTFLEIIMREGSWEETAERQIIQDLFGLLEETKRSVKYVLEFGWDRNITICDPHYNESLLVKVFNDKIDSLYSAICYEIEEYRFPISLAFIDNLVQIWSDGKLCIKPPVQFRGDNIIVDFTKEIEKAYYNLYCQQVQDGVIPIKNFGDLESWILTGLPLIYSDKFADEFQCPPCRCLMEKSL